MAIKVAVNRALTAITALPTAAALVDGNLTLLTTATASSSATLDFTSSIDSTYDNYMFKFYDMHPATDNVQFQFQTDTGTNTNYNQTITSTYFDAYHGDFASGGDAGLTYRTAYDQAQGTGFQTIAFQVDNGDDGKCDGTLNLFNPSSTTFVKHFIASSVSKVYTADYTSNAYCAGYVNTTTALTRVQFKFSSGNIDSGVIKMYGVGPKQS
tara:strand:- start:165 stop:797 length:633 start_codon:yes stop_codon:yes gene_type:complete